MENKLKIGLGIAKAAVLLALMAVINGCHQPTQVEAKSPTPVHLVDVTLDSSSRRFALLGFRFAIRPSELVVQIRRIRNGD